MLFLPHLQLYLVKKNMYVEVVKGVYKISRKKYFPLSRLL
jgi:hypothetical protein